jgi:hypothetical protein
MNLQDLIEIESEVIRFQKTIKEAIILAKSTPGYQIGNDNNLYGKNDISGTRMSGAVKRRAIDLKYYLTKKL